MSRLAHGQFLGDLNRSVEAGGFRIDLRVATLPPQAVVEHSHEHAHFILPLADGYRSLARDPEAVTRTVFSAGSAIYNPPGVVHRDCFDVEGGLFLSVSAPADLPTGVSHPALLRGEAETAMRRMVGLSLSGSSGRGLAAEDLALTLSAGVADTPTEARHVPDWLRLSAEIIADQASVQGLEIRQIAEQVGVHPVHLARGWRRHFRCSPASAIRHRRADHALQALRRGLGLVEAATVAGYADQSHMTREYTRIFGVTPGAMQAGIAGQV